jgi:hypothetical protein
MIKLGHVEIPNVTVLIVDLQQFYTQKTDPNKIRVRNPGFLYTEHFFLAGEMREDREREQEILVEQRKKCLDCRCLAV